ncbi:MAG: YCF48-related protein [Thermoguttaceae bacterium]
MLTSAVLALLLTIASQKDADRTAPPERPVFGVPSENAGPASASPAQAPNPYSDPNSICPESFLSDARLADVCFVDDQFGWAVGDHSAIWHTQDGGRQWRLQPCGVNCSLQSVCFLTRKIGYAAGGSAQPYSHTGAGVLLATRDGGQTWTGNPRLMLPALKKILFIDPDHGWAIGFPSAMYGSGVFTSDDGGRSWRPLFGSGGSAWLTGDFISPTAGALAGCYAAAATAGRGGIESFCINDSGLQNLRQLRLVPPLYGWLVGDGGLVLLTGNAGAAWRAPSGNFPAHAARYFDFAALAVRGPKAWIAGTPGTRVFFTPDAGTSWTSFSTGVSTPLAAMTFLDDEHGWAVGSLGTILATGDGGRTWQRQRSGGTRAAVLALFAQADDVPLELLAKLSGNDGYLSAVEVLTRRDVEVRPNDDVPLAERLQQAVISVGGSQADLAWQFPLRQSGLQLTAQQYIKGWDVIHNGRGMDALEEHIVRQLRLWRPDAVVTNNTNSPGADQLGPLIGKAVLQAVDKAADPTCCPGQIADAGLSPWQVKKVYAAADTGTHGPIDLSASQFSARLGRSLADAATEPRGLLTDRFSLPPTILGFSALADRAPDSQQSRDLMAGLALAPGGEARRDLSQAPLENIDALQRMALKQRNAQAILDQALRNPGEDANLLAQSGELIRGLDDNTAARIIYRIADQYHRTGRWPLAAQSYAMLAERYPQHPLARQALLWLVQYYASGEIAWQEQSGQKAALGQTSREKGDSPHLPERPEGGFAQMGTVPFFPQDRLDHAAALGKQIERTRPDLFAEPALRFPLAAAWRMLGLPKAAEQFYLLQTRGPEPNAWSACAQGELWLADPKNKQSKPVQKCWKAAAKPKLDGRLDDAVWQKVESVPLKSALKDDDDWPALVAFAYDDEFLYIAVSCRRAPGVKYEPAATPRPRDADLTAQDHVDILIDIDRGFATYYRLSIDYRGFTADSLWGDAAWNPTWFVAANLTDDAWTIEAAVPLDQLNGSHGHSAGADGHSSDANAGKAPVPPVKGRDAWAVGVQRTIPGVGFQSWSTPASTQVTPEGFGYLIFE